MKRNIFKHFTTIALAVLLFSCGNDNDSSSLDEITDPESDTEDISAYAKMMTKQLTGTSWNLYKLKQKYDNGTTKEYECNATISFAPNEILYYVNCEMNDGVWYSGQDYWYFTEDDMLMTNSHSLKPWNAEYAGRLMWLFGKNRIISLTDTELILNDEGNLIETTRYLERVPYIESSEGGGGENNTGDVDEEIYFTGNDYTSTRTSVTVKFYTNVRATSATVKYGQTSTSSSLSASVSGTMITATIGGLKPGTKYYVKCIAKNGSQSCTSDEMSVMTNY